jgi:hypothetical protein
MYSLNLFSLFLLLLLSIKSLPAALTSSYLTHLEPLVPGTAHTHSRAAFTVFLADIEMIKTFLVTPTGKAISSAIAQPFLTLVPRAAVILALATGLASPVRAHMGPVAVTIGVTITCRW